MSFCERCGVDRFTVQHPSIVRKRARKLSLDKSLLIALQKYLTEARLTENWVQGMSVWASAPHLLLRGCYREAVYGSESVLTIEILAWKQSAYFIQLTVHKQADGLDFTCLLVFRQLVELQPLWSGFQEGWKQHRVGSFLESTKRTLEILEYGSCLLLNWAPGKHWLNKQNCFSPEEALFSCNDT